MDVKTIFLYFVFFSLMATVCQSSDPTTDQLLEMTLIKIDKNCVREKIGIDKYNRMKYELKECNSTESFQRPPQFSGKPEHCSSAAKPTCPAIILDKFNECLTDAQKLHLKYSNDSIIAATRTYACGEGAKVLEGLKELDSQKCARVQNQLEKCIEFMPKTDLKMEEFYEKENCQAMEKLMRCLADALGTCTQVMSKYMMGISYAALKATPCKDYVNGSNPVSGLNLSLVAIIYLCVLLQYSMF